MAGTRSATHVGEIMSTTGGWVFYRIFAALAAACLTGPAWADDSSAIDREWQFATLVLKDCYCMGEVCLGMTLAEVEQIHGTIRRDGGLTCSALEHGTERRQPQSALCGVPPPHGVLLHGTIHQIRLLATALHDPLEREDGSLPGLGAWTARVRRNEPCAAEAVKSIWVSVKSHDRQIIAWLERTEGIDE